MGVRRGIVSGSFYPSGDRACRDQVRACLEDCEACQAGQPLAVIVPHAGWIFSGRTAGKAFAWLQSGDPDLKSVILLGADHARGSGTPSLYGRGVWKTPLGEAKMDEALADVLLEGLKGLALADEDAHAEEHSIEVQVPFVQILFPEAKILPMIVPPHESAVALGLLMAEVLQDREGVVVVGTSDLTHYGLAYGFTPKGLGAEAHRWVKDDNDHRIIELLLEMKAEAVIEEASGHHNACGAGALAALAAYARQRGSARGILLEQTTSHEVMPQGPPEHFVGYASIGYALPKE